MTLKVNFHLKVYFRIYNEIQMIFINLLFSYSYKTYFHYMKITTIYEGILYKQKEGISNKD